MPRPRIHPRRASALILAIATLGLLALLATVYLITSRTDRGSAIATDDSVNLDFARDAVLSQIQTRLYQQMTSSGNPTTLLDIPPVWQPNRNYLPFKSADIAPGPDQNELALGPDFRLYACTTQHLSDFAHHGPPPGNTLDWVPIHMDQWKNLGPLASRWYDYPEAPLPGHILDFGIATDRNRFLDGACDESLLVRDLFYPGIGSSDLSLLDPARYNPASGRYDLPFNPSPLYTPSTGDFPLLVPHDSSWQLLPFSSANGTRYRFAIRVVDANRMANLNTGFLGSSITNTDPDGVSFASAQLDASSIFRGPNGDDSVAILRGNPDLPAALNADRRGQLDDRTEPYRQFEWQKRIANYWSAGHTNGDGHLIFSTPTAAFPLTLFDLSDELELRARGGLGTGYFSRPELDWSHTLAPITKPSDPRNFYTAFSWEQQRFPTAGDYYALILPPVHINPLANFTGGGSPLFTCPATPTGVLNPADGQVQLSNYFFSWLNTLSRCGYSPDEAVSFALTAAYQATGNPCLAVIRESATDWFYIDWSGGPKNIYKAVFYAPNVSLPYPLNPPPTSLTPPSDVYLPCTAQPFLNEMDIILQPPDSKGRPPTALDYAVELLNPYTSHQYDLTGLRLRVGNQVWFTFGDKHTPHILPVASDASHPGLLAVNLAADAGGFRSTDPDLVTVPNKSLDPVGQTLYLERPFLDSTGNIRWMPIDSFTWTKPVPPLYPGGPPETLCFQRNNVTVAETPTQPTPGAVDGWLAACPGRVDELPVPSLGKPNPVAATDPRLFGPYLPDRYFDSALSPAAFGTRDLFNRNLGQIEYIPRLGPRMTGSLPSTVPDQLADTTTLFPSAGRSYFPQEAKVRFDFLADPRTIELMRCLTAAPLNPVPGRINVNTASGEVLFAVLRNITLNDATARSWVAAILSYRDRISPALIEDPKYANACPDFGFSDAATFPGRGIRSIAELAIPLGLINKQLIIDHAQSPAQIAPAPHQTLLTLHGTPYIGYANPWSVNSAPVNYFILPPNSKNIFDVPAGVSPAHPGALWPRLFAQLTVRSDTFIVYGYLEALRIHPHISANPNDPIHHDNSYNWYDQAPGGHALDPAITTVDDPAATTDQLSTLRNQRLVRRRFIAIIDRSLVDKPRNGLTSPWLPRIVALKDMPDQ